MTVDAFEHLTNNSFSASWRSFNDLADEVHARFGGLVSGVTLRPPVDTKYDDALRSSIRALKGI